MGEEPKNVPDVLKYELLEKSAAAIKKNNELNTKRADALLTTMRYRAPLPRKDFERAAEPRYGPIRVADKIEAGLVTDADGNTAPIKIVSVVPAQRTSVCRLGCGGFERKKQICKIMRMRDLFARKRGY